VVPTAGLAALAGIGFQKFTLGTAFTDLCGLVLHLQQSDRFALTVAGMRACLGAVVRAPITSIYFHSYCV
jgi:H+/Cl- antiporter ClcA